MNFRIAAILLFFLAAGDLFAQLSKPDELVSKAERLLYAFGQEGHLDRLEETLGELEKADPNLPYLYWAKARLNFWRKEDCYALEGTKPRDEVTKMKLDYADRCHAAADRCIALDPKNAECHLMKGVCYSMQASTWGASLKSVRILKPMDQEWEKAVELPSSFPHPDGVATRQLAMVLRGILYRVMPDSFWLRLLAGIRGDKEKSYRWIKEGAIPVLRTDPVIAIEVAAAALCSGEEKEDKARIEEGLGMLREALLLPARYAMDLRDGRNMKYLLEHPEEACNYRRERFEKVTKDSLGQ